MIGAILYRLIYGFILKISIALLILQPLRRFTYVTAHSPALPSLYLRHSSFSSFRCFAYVTGHSPTLLSLLLRHRLFTDVTWRAGHGSNLYFSWTGSNLLICVSYRLQQKIFCVVHRSTYIFNSFCQRINLINVFVL